MKVDLVFLWFRVSKTCSVAEISNAGVIEISDDEEEKGRESNGGHDHSRSSKFSFFL